MPSIIKIQDNNIDKIVSVNGQILQAPVSAGNEAIYTVNASKGTVSSNTISVTPSLAVTSAGLVSAGTEQGTPVTISASELVSGSLISWMVFHRRRVKIFVVFTVPFPIKLSGRNPFMLAMSLFPFHEPPFNPIPHNSRKSLSQLLWL